MLFTIWLDYMMGYGALYVNCSPTMGMASWVIARMYLVVTNFSIHSIGRMSLCNQ